MAKTPKKPLVKVDTTRVAKPVVNTNPDKRAIAKLKQKQQDAADKEYYASERKKLQAKKEKAYKMLDKLSADYKRNKKK